MYEIDQKRRQHSVQFCDLPGEETGAKGKTIGDEINVTNPPLVPVVFVINKASSRNLIRCYRTRFLLQGASTKQGKPA